MSNSLTPLALKPSPTNKFFAIAAPPAVLNVPLLKFELGVVSVSISEPLDLIFQSTCNASSGNATLIPTVLLITRNVVDGIPSRLICRSILLPGLEL